MGRGTVYDNATTPEIAKALFKCGFTDEEVAEEFGVTVATLYNWEKKYPKFARFRQEGKSFPVAKAVNALMKRVEGYETKERVLRPVKQIQAPGKPNRPPPVVVLKR